MKLESGDDVWVGNWRLLAQEGIQSHPLADKFLSQQESAGRTALLVARNELILGGVAVADTLRTEAKEMVTSLRQSGIQNIVMLTGDNQTTANTIAEEVGIDSDSVRAQLLPEEKLDYIRQLQSENQKVAMIGDGVNDAPALMVAEVGVAMGAIGTDVAIESAGIVLMGNDLRLLNHVIGLSRKSLRLIKQNIILFAVGMNIVGIALAGIDVAQRGTQAAQNFKNGNYAAASLDIAGAGLGALTAVPGPIGWAALAAQVGFDIARARGRSTQKNSYDLDGNILLEYELGGYLLIEQDEEDYMVDDEDKEVLQGYMSLLVQELRKALPVVGDIDDEDEEFLQNLEAGEIGAPEDIEKIIKILEKLQSGGKDYDKKQVKESYVRYLSESRKANIIRDLKKPVVIPETKQKSYKVKPKIRGLENNAIVSKPVATPKEYKPPMKMWGRYEYNQNVRASQERKNEVLNLLGEGEGVMDYRLNNGMARTQEEIDKFWGKNKDLYNFYFNNMNHKVLRKEQVNGDCVVFLVDEKGKKMSMHQSELNEKLAEADEQKLLDEYNKLNPQSEPISYEKDPLFKKVSSKLKPVINYPKKPSPKGYPDKAPPKLVNGFHPDLGKRYKYDKLDPQSAESMPPQGNPEIDANIEKFTDKNAKIRKIKNLIGKKS